MEREGGGVAVLTGSKVSRFLCLRSYRARVVAQVVGMDTKKSEISLEGGHVISYDKCLLATGGRPKTLPVFDSAPESVKKHVSLYRKVQGVCVELGGEVW